jgi:phospholipid/cholesterol/gamma-HCH transport system ATP-binding protein
MIDTPEIAQEKSSTHPEREPIIEVSHLVLSFGNNHVLKDYNLTVHKGENVVVLGKSGSGKSVLIKCISGLLNYDGGEIKVFGNEVSSLDQKSLDAFRARIGFVFQSSALYDSMSVRGNLEFPLRRHGREKTKDEIDNLIHDTLDDVGLLDTIDKMPAELSGGMKKRVGLARALILKPEIMLYDEPTTGLDPITSREISELMVTVQEKYNTSSIIITHDMHCAKLAGDRITILLDGICYANGTFDEVSAIKDPKVHSFFQ